VGVFGWLALAAVACSEDDDPPREEPCTNCATGGVTGGAPNATGGASTGGTATGGATTGGNATGGSATGGNATGGNATGGAGKGGSAAGGAATGGASATGGSASGGIAGAGSGGVGGVGGGSSGMTGSGGGSAHAMMNFFVTSDSSKTANLGGLEGADMRCQMLAAAVGHGSKTWRAYLSTEDPAVNARDRIGDGPYVNSKGAEVAASKDALHMRTGDAEVFLDEKGNRINGQWMGSPTPNEHDILTGTLEDGTVSKGMTCDDWTGTSGMSQVGHSDGLGPMMNSAEPYSIWNGSHTGQCGNTQPGGGAGKIYCFVGP
jgi:hypothetical protein